MCPVFRSITASCIVAATLFAGSSVAHALDSLSSTPVTITPIDGFTGGAFGSVLPLTLPVIPALPTALPAEPLSTPPTAPPPREGQTPECKAAIIKYQTIQEILADWTRLSQKRADGILTFSALRSRMFICEGDRTGDAVCASDRAYKLLNDYFLPMSAGADFDVLKLDLETVKKWAENALADIGKKCPAGTTENPILPSPLRSQYCQAMLDGYKQMVELWYDWSNLDIADKTSKADPDRKVSYEDLLARQKVCAEPAAPADCASPAAYKLLEDWFAINGQRYRPNTILFSLAQVEVELADYLKSLLDSCPNESTLDVLWLFGH